MAKQSSIHEQLQTEVVYATDKNKHHKTGAEIKTTPEMAEHLIKKGYASKEKPKGK